MNDLQKDNVRVEVKGHVGFFRVVPFTQQIRDSGHFWGIYSQTCVT